MIPSSELAQGGNLSGNPRAESALQARCHARQTFASLLIDAGVNAKAIQTLVGHATIQMTFDRYGHLMPGSREQARELVDAYLDAAEQDARGGASRRLTLAGIAARLTRRPIGATVGAGHNPLGGRGRKPRTQRRPRCDRG
jgi:hypothetical protein